MKIDLAKFKDITGYDIETFLNDVSTFVSTQYRDVVGYYTGRDFDKTSFTELKRLVDESKKIEPLFEFHKSRLDTVDFWELLDIFSDIQIKLLTIEKTGKWMRSSRTGFGDGSVKVSRVLTQNENFETVLFDLGDTDAQENWKGLTSSNFIEEEMYTPDGGVMFTLPITPTTNIDLPSVIDYFTPNNIFGKDIKRRIEFVGNDLATVEGKDALYQSFDIRVSLFKGDIPEFPADGLSPDLIGGSFASIQYPTIIRDVLNVFRKDSRWREINVVDLFRENDAILLKIACNSVSNDTFVNNIVVQ